MFYMFDKTNKNFFGSCDNKPNDSFIQTSNLILIESDNVDFLNKKLYLDANNNITTTNTDVFLLIDELKNEVKEKKNTAENSAILYENTGSSETGKFTTYDADMESVSKMIAAKSMLELKDNETIEWVTADNNKVKLNANDLNNIIAAIVERNNRITQNYYELKDDADTLAESYSNNKITEEEFKNMFKSLQDRGEKL